jgi:hypothetical protein
MEDVSGIPHVYELFYLSKIIYGKEVPWFQIHDTTRHTHERE